MPPYVLGVFLHAVGGFAAGSFYAPLKKVQRWSWESSTGRRGNVPVTRRRPKGSPEHPTPESDTLRGFSFTRPSYPPRLKSHDLTAMRTTSISVAVAALISMTVAGAQTPLKTVRVASGLSRPLDVQAPPGDRHRIFIVEQTGRIKIVKDGTLLGTPFLNLSSRVACCSERGLLGLAFHPDYAKNGYFFVDYTTSSPFGATMVERYTVSANPDVANPSSRKVVIGPIAQPYSNHNGGCIQFGKDGYLYIGTGDGGASGDPQCNGQRGNTLLGKLLRIDVDTTTSGYVIPPTNPFVRNTAFRNEIWAYGLRNPWRFSFDRATGDLYIGDVGQNALEEIDFQPGSSKGGENYGWKIMEGTNCFSTSACPAGLPLCRDPRLKPPIHEYGRATGRCITGGNVYRGCAIPDLAGTYFFADYATRRIWSFRYTNGQVTNFRNRTSELGWTGAVSSFGVDDCGEIYICSYSTFGAVYKIVAAVPPPAVDLGFGKIGGNGKKPTFDACGLLTSGSSAVFRLYDAPPSALSLLGVSLQSNPISLFGGTVVPIPLVQAVFIATDKDGKVEFPLPGGQGPFSIFAQFLIDDPKATFGIGISNALRIDVQK